MTETPPFMRGMRRWQWPALVVGLSVLTVLADGWPYPVAPQVPREDLSVVLTDVVKFPVGSGKVNRIGVLREEPGSGTTGRLFVSDLNGRIYTLDSTTRSIGTYIDFVSIFPKFVDGSSLGTGLSTFAFDPDYERTGRFFTVHSEAPQRSGSAMPNGAGLPGLDLTGYTMTVSIDPPGMNVTRQSVLIEWRDIDTSDAVFQGTAREVLRMGFEGNNHPIADLVFNPAATPGHPDWGNLYIAVGDGGSGQVAGQRHLTPQRLDLLPGKILRVTPDISLRPADALGSNGRYRVPTTGSDPNPFVSLSLPDLKPEIYAYGLRNPQRMSWDLASSTLFVVDIGLASWEEINVVRKGANYGYAAREGGEQLFVGGPNNARTGSQLEPAVPLPMPDVLTVEGLVDPVMPTYPVATYSHRDGDAIAGGFVYWGSKLPHLQGKYVFGDITTGRLLYADVDDMLAADDGNPATMAPVRELQVQFDNPRDVPDRGLVVTRLFDVVADEFAASGGRVNRGVLPDAADHMSDGLDTEGVPYGGGRADIRLAMDRSGELYVLSKNDGMLRAISESRTGATITSLQVDGTSSPAETPVEIRVSVASRAGAPTGQVEVLDGTTRLAVLDLENGGATFEASGLSPGTHTLQARYLGTPNFQGSISVAIEHLVVAADTALLTVIVEGAGSVTSQPAGLSCPGVCRAEFASGSTVTLVPVATSSTVFTGWGGACSGLDACVVSLDTSAQVTASFGVRRPDLLTSVGVSVASVAPGAKLSVTDTTSNTGSVAAASSRTRFFLSTDALRDAADVVFGTRNVAALAPGLHSMRTNSLTVPAGMPYGTYRVIGCADADGAVQETDEQNNCSVTAGSVAVSRPDLRQVSVSIAVTSVAPGGTLTVIDSVVNDGGHATSTKTSTRYYLSTDVIKSSDDSPLDGARAIASLAPGASSTGSKALKVPASTPLGPRHLIACADDTNKVVELIEHNNCAATSTTVHVGRPDLVVSTVGNPPSVVAAGAKFPIGSTTVNQGTVPSNKSSTRFYLSVDGSKDALDVALPKARAIAALPVGGTSTGTSSLTVPATVARGAYLLLACADDTATNDEVTETNNCRASVGTVTIP